MKLIYWLYFPLATFVCVFLYISVFGEAGDWRRQELENTIRSLEDGIESLSQENRLLHEKHMLIREGAVEARPEPFMGRFFPPGTIIIKFDGAPPREQGSGPAKEALSITEARALFIVGALLFLILGFYLVTRLIGREDERRQA